MKITPLLLFCCITFSFLFAQTQNSPLVKSIFFGGGDYYINRQQKQELNEFLDGIDGLESYQIIVNSHTDSIGSLEYNQWLSNMRSEATIRILEQRGIPATTISRRDYGETNPDFNNSTWEGKLKNRRADVIIVPPDS